MLKQVAENPTVNKEKIDIMQDKIDTINKEILDFPAYLATISL